MSFAGGPRSLPRVPQDRVLPQPGMGTPQPGWGNPQHPPPRPPPRIRQQMEYLLCGGRYISCVHVAGLLVCFIIWTQQEIYSTWVGFCYVFSKLELESGRFFHLNLFSEISMCWSHHDFLLFLFLKAHSHCTIYNCDFFLLLMGCKGAGDVVAIAQCKHLRWICKTH